MRSNSYKYFTLIALAMATPSVMWAADAAGTAEKLNMTLISMVSLMIILLYIIGMLANTLRILGGVIHEKIKEDKRKAKNLVKSIALFLTVTIPTVIATAAEPAAAEAAPAPAFISGIPTNDFYLMSGFIILELIMILSLALYIRILLKILRAKPVVEGVPEVKKSWFWDDFNAAVPIEKEKDLLLDHDYDGIRELDNSLPPWWKYGFYLTIIVGVIYIARFHITGDGLSQEQEYLAEMQKGEEDKAAYLAQSANNVDENTVVYLSDGASLASGKDLFIKNCAACHLADGGGSVGPNLTDAYWIHSGGIKDIFKSIKYGWQEKGMKSWKDDFSPKQIQEIASFVKSLQGTKPAAPKAAQGALYIDATAPATDSAAAPKDSTATAAPATDSNKKK